MVMATYFYYENVRRTMRTAIVSNLLNYARFLLLSYIFLRIKNVYDWILKTIVTVKAFLTATGSQM